MTDSSKLIRAAVFAADAHREQRRKGRKKTPYINHPLGVAAVLSVEAGVHDTNLLMAALLHDTVEDTETSFDDLEETFGPVIASLVREVSDDKSRTKAERKRLQVKHAADASEGAKQVKIADKICNIRDIAYDPPSDWSHERRLEYLDWAEEVVVACRGVNEELDALFNVVITDARRTVNREDP